MDADGHQVLHTIEDHNISLGLQLVGGVGDAAIVGVEVMLEYMEMNGATVMEEEEIGANLSRFIEITNGLHMKLTDIQKPGTHVLDPCKHGVTCHNCARKLEGKHCPICYFDIIKGATRLGLSPIRL
mmetsp:Transcript_3897/g.5755  ORF Transcript_3897/g.5755 Transcript_3897/m.5755 type:complete len:127 (+) Transcript_3897:1654-2034(+)